MKLISINEMPANNIEKFAIKITEQTQPIAYAILRQYIGAGINTYETKFEITKYISPTGWECIMKGKIGDYLIINSDLTMIIERSNDFKKRIKSTISNLEKEL